MEEIMLVARKVNKGIYGKFKRKVVEKGIKVGQAISEAMELWIKSDLGTEHKYKNIMKLCGVIKTKEKGRWSEEVDKILYGLEK